MKLRKPLKIERAGAETRVIDEIKLNVDMITAKVILNAENELLSSGKMYPAHDMTSSKTFQAIVLAELLDLRISELEEMNGKDFIELTGEISTFFGSSVLDRLQEMILGS